MTKIDELTTSLALLFGDANEVVVATALHKYLGSDDKRYYELLNALATLRGEQLVSLAASDILTGFDERSERYTGTRAYLNALVTGCHLPDIIFDALHDSRSSIRNMLRNSGFVEEIKP